MPLIYLAALWFVIYISFSGFYNNSLLAGCSFKSAIAYGIDLFKGPYFPFAKRGDGVTKGEVYDVSQEVLQRLDHLEGHPTYYIRERIQVILQNDKRIYAWIYLFNHQTAYPKIESGEWEG